MSLGLLLRGFLQRRGLPGSRLTFGCEPGCLPALCFALFFELSCRLRLFGLLLPRCLNFCGFAPRGTLALHLQPRCLDLRHLLACGFLPGSFELRRFHPGQFLPFGFLFGFFQPDLFLLGRLPLGRLPLCSGLLSRGFPGLCLLHGLESLTFLLLGFQSLGFQSLRLTPVGFLPLGFAWVLVGRTLEQGHFCRAFRRHGWGGRGGCARRFGGLWSRWQIDLRGGLDRRRRKLRRRRVGSAGCRLPRRRRGQGLRNRRSRRSIGRARGRRQHDAQVGHLGAPLLPGETKARESHALTAERQAQQEGVKQQGQQQCNPHAPALGARALGMKCRGLHAADCPIQTGGALRRVSPAQAGQGSEGRDRPRRQRTGRVNSTR